MLSETCTHSLMSYTQSQTKMLLEDDQQSYSEIQQEDWVKDLLNKLSPEEQHVVLDAFRDLKRFHRKKSS